MAQQTRDRFNRIILCHVKWALLERLTKYEAELEVA